MYIDPTSPIPKHVQFRKIIERMIVDEELPIGAKLPSEWELSKKYGVSRATVRRALSDLINEGVLFSYRGKGTFVVRPQKLDSKAYSSIQQAIAFLSPSAPYNDYVTSRISAGIEQTAQLNSRYVILTCSNDSVDWEKHILEDLTKNHLVEGLVIIPSNQDYKLGHEHIARLRDRGVPFILVDKFFRDLPTDYVISDNETGAYKAVSHLISLGHRRIGYVIGSEHMGTSIEDRLSGYKKALIDHGLPFNPEFVIRMGEEGRELRSLLHQKKFPSALFCVNDLTALRVIRIINEEGMKVPDDVGVVGYDDMDILKDIGINLTTVRQPLHEEGKMAVVKLMRRIRGEVKPDELQRVVLTSTLIVRGSCGSSTKKIGPIYRSSKERR